MSVVALLAQRALRARRDRRLARPATIGPYSRIRLDMHQVDGVLTLEALTGPSLQFDDVWLLLADEWIKVGSWESSETTFSGQPAVRHRAVVTLDEVALEFPAEPDDDEEPGAKTSIWVSVTEDGERRPPRYSTEVISTDEALSYRVPLGRFQRTEPTDFSRVTNAAGYSLLSYVNRNGHLALAIDRIVRATVRVEVSHLHITDGRLAISGALGSRHTDHCR